MLTLTLIESAEEGIDMSVRVEGFEGAVPFRIYMNKWFDTGQGIRFQTFSTLYLYASDSWCAVIKKIEELSTGSLLNISYPCSSADSIYELYPYDPGPHVLLPSTDGSVWREGDVGKVLLSLHGNSGGFSYDIVVAPKDACHIDMHLDILELDGFVRKSYISGEVQVLKALEFVAKWEHPSTYTCLFFSPSIDILFHYQLPRPKRFDMPEKSDRSWKQNGVQYGVFPLVHLDIFLVAADREGNFIPGKQVDLSGMLGLVENMFGYVLISLVLLYNEAKLAFFIYLWFPGTKETMFVQDSFFRPVILRYKIGIDKTLLVMRTQAGYILFLYWKYSIDACREFVVLHKLMRSLDTTYPFDLGQLKIVAIQVTSVVLEFGSLPVNERINFIQVKARIVEIPLIAAVNFQFMVPSVKILPTFSDCSASKVFVTVLLRNKVTWYTHQWVGVATKCRVLANEPLYDICFSSLLMAKMRIKEVDDFAGIYSNQMAAKEAMKEKSIPDPITIVISYLMQISCRAEAFSRAHVFKNMAAKVFEFILCLKLEGCSCIIGLHLVVNMQRSCYLRVNRGHTWLLLLELKIQALASIQYGGDYSNSRGPKALLTFLKSAWMLILRGLNNSKALYFMNPLLQTLPATSILGKHFLRVEHNHEVVLLYRGWPYNSLSFLEPNLEDKVLIEGGVLLRMGLKEY